MLNFKLILPALILTTLFLPYQGQAAKTNQPTTVEKQVRAGDTIFSILRRLGFQQSHLSQIIENESLYKRITLIPRQVYFLKESNGKTEVLFLSDLTDRTVTFFKKGDQAGVASEKEDFETEVGRVTGWVRGSLVASIQNIVPSKKLAYRFLDAYVFDYKVQKQLQRNARFHMVFEKKFLDGKLVKYGEVLETGLEIKGDYVVRKFLPFADGGSFVDEQKPFLDRPFFAPVNYVRVSSLYQPYRFHPVKRRRMAHLGMDFELEQGKPIFSVGHGTIVKFGRNRAAGRYVVVKHPNGLTSYYNHMSSVQDFEINQTVSAGALLGTIGCTGYCTKPHLHFAIKKNGKFVDPITYIRPYAFTQRHNVEQLLSKAASDSKSQTAIK